MSIRIAHRGKPLTDHVAWQLALDGDLPADALTTVDRGALVLVLHSHGWTDVEIACWTRMTTYTTARIRARLGLAANKIEGAVA